MATIQSQLLKLKSQIKLPYKIIFVDKEIKKDLFEERTIYIHITI